MELNSGELRVSLIVDVQLTCAVAISFLRDYIRGPILLVIDF